jgi:hypothetical protein
MGVRRQTEPCFRWRRTSRLSLRWSADSSEHEARPHPTTSEPTCAARHRFSRVRGNISSQRSRAVKAVTMLGTQRPLGRQERPRPRRSAAEGCLAAGKRVRRVVRIRRARAVLVRQRKLAARRRGARTAQIGRSARRPPAPSVRTARVRAPRLHGGRLSNWAIAANRVSSGAWYGECSTPITVVVDSRETLGLSAWTTRSLPALTGSTPPDEGGARWPLRRSRLDWPQQALG